MVVQILSVVLVGLMIAFAAIAIILLNRHQRGIREIEVILQELIEGVFKAPSDRFRIPSADSIAAGWPPDTVPGLRNALQLQQAGRDREAIVQALSAHEGRLPCEASVYLRMHAGNGLLRLELYDEAEEQFEEAMALARDGDFAWGVGAALLDLSILADFRRDPDPIKAQQYGEQALEVFQQLPDGANAGTLTHLGNLAMHRQEFETAERHYREALDIFTRIGSRGGQGCALGGIGNAYLQLGDLKHAREYLDRAAQILRRIGDSLELARTTASLGELHEKAGDRDSAERCYREARSLFSEARGDSGVQWMDEQLASLDA